MALRTDGRAHLATPAAGPTASRGAVVVSAGRVVIIGKDNVRQPDVLPRPTDAPACTALAEPPSDDHVGA